METSDEIAINNKTHPLVICGQLELAALGLSVY
jgi:hypothetical protein